MTSTPDCSPSPPKGASTRHRPIHTAKTLVLQEKDSGQYISFFCINPVAEPNTIKLRAEGLRAVVSIAIGRRDVIRAAENGEAEGQEYKFQHGTVFQDERLSFVDRWAGASMETGGGLKLRKAAPTERPQWLAPALCSPFVGYRGCVSSAVV